MKISTLTMQSYVLLIGTLLLIDVVIGSLIPFQSVPVSAGYRLVQIPYPYQYLQQVNFNTQTKVPFDLTSQLIQQTPILINVPDILPNIATGSQLVQNGLQQILPIVENGVSQIETIGNGLHQVHNAGSQISENVDSGISLIVENVDDGLQQAQNGVSQIIDSDILQVNSGVSQIEQNVENGINQLTQNIGNGFQNSIQLLSQRGPIIGNIGVSGIPVVTNNKNQLVGVTLQYPGGQQLILGNNAFP